MTRPFLALICIFAAAVATPAAAASDTANCPKITIPAVAAVIAVAVSGGDAMADVYLGDPDAPSSVVDVEIEPGSSRIYVVAKAASSVIWRFTGDTRRVAGGLFIGDRSMVTNLPAPSGVVGLRPETVTIPLPGTCELAVSPQTREQRLFAELSGREIDSFFGAGARIALPSGEVRRFDDRSFYRYPGETAPRLTPAAARLWLEFLKVFPGGLVDVDPDRVVSPYPAKDYDVLPGLLGLAQLVSDGTLELTATPDDLGDWWGKLGADWIDIGLSERLGKFLREERGNPKVAAGRQWLRTTLADWTITARLGENPEADLNGNRFRLDGNEAVIEDAQGNWVRLTTIEFIIRGPFTLPPAVPGAARLPMFLLPEGVPEPVGPFGRRVPLLREAAD